MARDGTGPDDRDLHGEVVNVYRLETRQRGHLRAALDLEDAHGVGRTDLFVGFRVFDGNVVHGARAVRALRAELDRFLYDRHHAEAEEIDFHDAEILAVILVPLADAAV